MKANAHVLSADQVLSIPSTGVQQERRVRIVVRARLCRHCKCRIPFFRSLLKAAFCNRNHERDYVKNMEELALERLSIAAERLKLASKQMSKRLAEPPAAI